MTTRLPAPPAPEQPAAPRAVEPGAVRPALACAQPPAEATTCPACGDTMRLWANYYRCRTCGFKESCCF